MKAPSALQRGMACLCCRKRKMKCDGARPVCTQCSKANRGEECQYYEKKRTSRTQLLQAKITKLEARLRELEAEQSSPESSSSSGSLSPEIAGTSLTFQQHADISLGLDGSSVYSTPELLDSDFLAGFQLDNETLFSNFQQGSSHGSVVGWTADDDLDFPSNVDPFLPSTSGSSSSSLHSSGSATNWWENDVFCENKQALLDIFVAHRHQCGFDVHIGRFKAALLLPSPQQPHHSLVDAIYLLACYFSRSPSLTELEPHFLKRSLRGISDALQHSDRIVHVLQASCLLAVYFFWHGRTLEGYYHSSIAARLAVGLGLHQIDAREWAHLQTGRAGYQAPAPLKASVPLGPPVDEVEYAERVAAFWQIFAVDRAWAVATGLPSALPDDDHPRSRITTNWPIAIPNDPEPTVGDSLLQPFSDSHLSHSSPSIAFRVKAIALFERTARFSAAPSREDSLQSLEMSLTQFLGNLNNLGNQHYMLPYMLSDADVVAMKTLIYAAMIHLHRDTLEVQANSYQKCGWAANSISALIRQLADNDFDQLCPIISSCWRSAADVYMRILAMPAGQSLPANHDLVEQQLDTIVAAMQRLSCLFPIAAIHASRIQEDRTTPRQPSYTPSVM